MLRRKIKEAYEGLTSWVKFLIALGCLWLGFVGVLLFFGTIFMVVMRIIAALFGLSWYN